MENGLIQTFNNSGKDLSTTEFKSITIDLSDAIAEQNKNTIYISHVSTWLLINNIQKVSELTNASKTSINLELHTRIHRPIFVSLLQF